MSQLVSCLLQVSSTPWGETIGSEGAGDVAIYLQNSFWSFLIWGIFSASSLMYEHQSSLGKLLLGDSCKREQH